MARFSLEDRTFQIYSFCAQTGGHTISNVDGTYLLTLIQSLNPAVLLDHHEELSEEDLQLPISIRTCIQPYVSFCFENGVEGERFASDYWKNRMGMFHSWAVAVPEIIDFQSTIFLGCRWWNYNNGFSSQARITEVAAQLPDQSMLDGYIIYKRGVGYQPNSQYFVGKDGSLWEYKKKVISHEPVRWMPTGGINVGHTETIISTDLIPVRPDSDDLTEFVELIENSVKQHNEGGLRPVMKNYFSLA